MRGSSAIDIKVENSSERGGDYDRVNSPDPGSMCESEVVVHMLWVCLLTLGAMKSGLPVTES